MTGLVGRSLALASHPICQRLDPDQAGLTLAEIEVAVVAAGVEIGGSVSRQVLGTALNTSQDLFRQAPQWKWLWIEPVEPEGAALSGRALAEEAYRLATLRDPERRGVDYKDVLRWLQDEGVIIKGGNAGQTLYRAMHAATDWFEWIERATFRWKL
jgi:hypothetical protein